MQIKESAILICLVGQFADQTVSKPTCNCLSEFVWRPYSCREQVSKTKLNYQRSRWNLSLSQIFFHNIFWWHIRVIKVGDKVTYLVAHIYISCSNFVGLLDAGHQSHNTYSLRSSLFYAWYLLYDGEPVLLLKGKRVLPNPRHKRLWHINKFCKRRVGTIMLLLQSRHFLWPLCRSCSSSNLQPLCSIISI